MARSLGGTDADKIDCGTSSILNPTTAMTFVCWAYATSFPNTYNVIFKRIDAGGTHYYALQPDSTGKCQFFYVDSGNAGRTWSGTATLSTATWYQLGLVIPASGSPTGYINGALDSTGPSPNGGVATISAHTTLGWDTSTVNSGWAGRLADCAIYNVALTVNELLALARGARPFQIRPTALVGYWPLDGLASPEPDLSGNINNGTLTGTAMAPGPPVMMFSPRIPQLKTVVASSAVNFRRTLLGTRAGSRQAII